ncbi:MAG: FIST C-terminal domain-containing protein [Cyanobacteria bacterium P01_F01_bin.150]
MYLLSPSLDEIQTAIQKQLQPQDNEVVLILMGEATGINIDTLVNVLKQDDYCFIGAIFPSVLSAETYSEKGVMLKTIPLATPPHLIRDLNQQVELPEFDAEIDLSEDTQLTALIWIDGLTSQISTFLSEMYNNLGNSVRYLGGGAGSLSLQQQPCIFTREGCFQDAAVVVFSPLESQLGVRHGWQRLEGPFPATETHDNTITALNWRNAFEVYKEVVEADGQRAIAADNFFEVAKGYPFGIFKEGQEDIVRDPIVVNDVGELVCVGEVPENALLHILKGDKESLVTSARQAAIEATQGDPNKLTECLVVDCISRVLFLGDQFSEELTALKTQLATVSQSTALEGVLTLGEISSYGEGFLEFFNKTIVVGALYQQS